MSNAEELAKAIWQCTAEGDPKCEDCPMYKNDSPRDHEECFKKVARSARRLILLDRVRETWCDPSGAGYPFLYKADMPMHWDAEDTEIGMEVDLKAEDYTWHPSIHMPKEAARIFLRVNDVRAERLQEITDEDALAEGLTGEPYDHPNTDYHGCTDCMNSGWIVPPTVEFAELWDSTIKKADLPLYGWDANPWVWVIEFERCEKPKGWCE